MDIVLCSHGGALHRLEKPCARTAVPCGKTTACCGQHHNIHQAEKQPHLDCAHMQPVNSPWARARSRKGAIRLSERTRLKNVQRAPQRHGNDVICLQQRVRNYIQNTEDAPTLNNNRLAALSGQRRTRPPLLQSTTYCCKSMHGRGAWLRMDSY